MDLTATFLASPRRGRVVASKIAAHAGDVARGFGNAAQRDRTLSTARGSLDWQTHLDSAIDPVTARAMFDEACRQSRMPAGSKGEDYCTMCGREWCSVRINKELRQTIK